MAVPVIVDGLYVNVVLDDVPAVILNVILAVPIGINKLFNAVTVCVDVKTLVGIPNIIPVVVLNVNPVPVNIGLIE